MTPPEVVAWLRAAAEGAADLAHALQAVACAEAMPRLAGVLPAGVWHDLLTRLLALASDARAIVLEDDPLPHQLLAGELPLTLAYLFPEIEPCRRMKSAAREALSSGLSDLLDGEGLPHARHLALLRPLLACWTRCLALGQAIKGGCCTAAAQNQYRWLVGHALRLTRYDGTHVLSDDSPAEADRSLLDAALRLGGDRDDRAIAALALAERGQSRRKQGDESRLPAPAAHSEWACVAVMRRHWSRSGPCVTVLYDNRVLRTELRCGKDVLWSGEWGLDVRLDGRLVEPVGEWEETCWVSDEDVDFLELEMELAGGLRVQRHLTLAREDRFLLLADAVLGSPSGRIEYQGRLPLAPGVAFRGAEETREGYLVGGKRRALVMPLALPEWRTDRRFGELAWTDRRIGVASVGRRTRVVRPVATRPGSASHDPPLDLAAIDRGRIAGGPTAGRGRRLSRGGRQATMADLPLAGRGGQSHAPGPQPLERTAGCPVRPLGRSRGVGGSRVNTRAASRT